MTRRERLEAILAAAPIIPVITLHRADDAVPLARALAAGGITHVEITLRTPAALAGAAAIAAELPQLVLGIGTVLTPEDLAQAIRVGARFALSPGATPALLAAAASGDLPFIPGIATASEAMAALAAGFDVVKFFPAVAAGGIAAVTALNGPFPNLRFCPTGGIGEANFREWLAVPGVVSVGGSWLAPEAEIRAGRFAAITERARAAMSAIKG